MRGDWVVAKKSLRGRFIKTVVELEQELVYFDLQSSWTITPQPAVHFQAYDDIEIFLLHTVQEGDIIDKTRFFSHVCLARFGDFPVLDNFGSALWLAPPSFALTGVCDVQNESGLF